MVGRTVGGAYTLQKLVGVGGMGRVYRAEQTALGRTVAVKVIHPHLLGDEQVVARFYTEARASSRLNHPNSVGIIDFGRTDDGILFLVMEFLKGKDLALVMYEEGPLPFPRICEILIQTLGALGEAHALGVVHRDLKPENIILKRQRAGGDLVKVVDFGLATIVSGVGSTSVTTPGLVCGTPDYMAPEQGRGDQVDGRGDLYAVGVVLFELLTDQLPYEDETPTKVVLRHMNDPIPNPIEVAPQRSIPPVLAQLTIKALAKSRDQRWSSAEEFQEALRDALDTIRGKRATGEISCPSCGARNPATMRFCGSCGAKLALGGVSMPPSQRPITPSSRPSYQPPPTSRRPLVGREDELRQISVARAESRERSVWLHVTGEPGAGKTRLLNETAKKGVEEGEVVVGATPHPTRAPVPYGPIRRILAALLDVEPNELASLAATDEVFADPLVRAGVSEVASPIGLVGFEESGRTGAVTAALATAVRVGIERSRTRRVLLVVDDLHACDGLTQEVLRRLPTAMDGGGLLQLTAGFSAMLRTDEARVIALQGLDGDATRLFLAGQSEQEQDGRGSGLVRSARFMLPLYLEQVLALGGHLANDETLPPRLADAVAQRVERLDVGALRILQAVAVLGDSCDLDWLRDMTDTDISSLEPLRSEGLVRLTGDAVEMSHPFIRDLVESGIPAEARRGLHERALQLSADHEAPLEVRAEHAYRAGEPMSALMLLERMGDAALGRGDAVAAVLAFRRALELARKEMLEKGDVMLEGAILTFSRKLGEALERQGDVAGADGVLREALDLVGPASAERARMLLALGRVAARRERPRDAMRLLGQALELATAQKSEDVEARVQVALARVRHNEGDQLGAANAYRRAAELEERQKAEPGRHARTLLELGEVLCEVGDAEDARAVLEKCRNVAKLGEARAVMAMAAGSLATLDELSGRTERAAEGYREAARIAAEAGHAEGHARWRTAADSLS